MSRLFQWLRKNPAFVESTDDALKALTQGAEILELQRHVEFISEGDPPDRLFALVEGLTRVYHRHAPSGRQVTVKHLGAPCTLGEMQVMAGLAFIENAETLTPARLIRLRGDALRRFVELDHRATVALFADICTRFCIAARNERAVLFEVPSRLAGLVLSYADVFGAPGEKGLVIRYPLTQTSLADGLGIVERSVRRVLTSWKKSGWITLHKGWFVVCNAEALDALSGQLRFSINYRLGMDLAKLGRTSHADGRRRRK